MDKKIASLRKLFAKKEVLDYTYATLFFIISSLFAFFAIKPSLAIAFSLKKEAEELKKINRLYEKNIANIIRIQSELEAVRDKIYLIDAATPSKPDIKIIIDNVNETAHNSTITLKPFILSSVDLKSSLKNNHLKNIPINLVFGGDYQGLNDFIKDILTKRRLTIIKNLNITKGDLTSSESASLNSTMTIENYYL